MSKSIAVIGLGFGDEGKGMVTNYLCHHNPTPLVVRFSGGHQAGHTVVHEGIKHTFSNFGSGTLQGVPTYWSKECTVEPIGLLNELQILVDKMENDFDNIRIYINNDCPVTTPYDIAFNHMREKDHMHGSCGVGFGDTLQREEDGFHLKFRDLFNPTVLEIKLEMIRMHYGMFLDDTMLGVHTNFMDAVELLNDKTKFPIEAIRPVSKEPAFTETFIYEGSQGLLLDQKIGFFPHVTRSSVGAGELSKRLSIHEVYYVTRAYQTRHGNGPMTGEKDGIALQNTEGETNKIHDYQGGFRKSILDLDLLNYAMQQDSISMWKSTIEHLVITCLDQMVTWRFRQNGEVFDCGNEDKFIENVVSGLNFYGKVYLSRSANSQLKQWKGGKDV